MNENIEEIKEELEEELEEQEKKDLAEDLENFGETEEVLLLKNTIQELENKVKTVQADSINYRKRKDEEVSRMLKYANKDLILDLLNIQNTFKEAFKMLDKNKELENYFKGFKMIETQIANTLTNYGVTKIDCLNKEYDYNLEEAVMIEENKDKENNIVVEVFRDGYMLYDKVILPAQVKVNKNESEGK